jgi:hypothetical protein
LDEREWSTVDFDEAFAFLLHAMVLVSWFSLLNFLHPEYGN